MAAIEGKAHPIRKRMRQARRKADVTEQEMADDLGITRGTVWYNENRTGAPGDKLVGDYARFLGESEKYLRTGRRT